MNDTLLPNSGPSGGSRSNVMIGNALRWARDADERHAQADGTYRTYDEMVAEKIPLRYDGKWVAADCTACDAVTGQGKPFPIYMYELLMPRSRSTPRTAR